MKTSDHLSKHDYYVADCPLADGQALVREQHYAKGGSNTAVYMHGLYRTSDDSLVGVAWWLPPTRVAAESVCREDWKRVLSLTRLVVDPTVPTNGASFLLGRSIRLIRQDGRFPHLVTYADESQGHEGRIYLASNWDYVGRTGPYPRWLNEDGQQVSPKATRNRTKAQMEALGHRKVGSYHKHKYVLHLNECSQ